MRKYGIDDFTYSIIYYGLSYEDIKQAEVELIECYDAFRNGYNSTLGGDGLLGRVHTPEQKKKQQKRQSKTVHQYDLNGNYIQSYDSVKEAEHITNAASISLAISHLRGEYKSGGYMWSYDKVDKLPPYIFGLWKRVHQYDINHNYITSYDSLTAAAAKYGGKASTISRVCHGKRKTAYGYIWRFTNE